jgi:hypothetical protein
MGLSQYMRRKVNLLIAQGYGCEDIRHKTGTPVEIVRKVVAEKRAEGSLHFVPLKARVS